MNEEQTYSRYWDWDPSVFRLHCISYYARSATAFLNLIHSGAHLHAAARLPAAHELPCGRSCPGPCCQPAVLLLGPRYTEPRTEITSELPIRLTPPPGGGLKPS